MNARISIIFIIIFALFLISGCAKQTATTDGTGLILEDVHIMPKTAYPEEEIGISALIKNTGSVDADKIEITLKNDGFKLTEGKPTKSIEILEAQKEKNAVNNIEYIEWSAISNTNNNPFDIKYKPSFELCYHYQTKAIIKIKSMPIEEYRMLQDRGILPEKYLESTQTKGPIQMNIIANPILLKRQGKDNKITLNIDVVNTGLKKGGSVYLDDCSNENINKAEITAKIIGGGKSQTQEVDFLRGVGTVIFDDLEKS